MVVVEALAAALLGLVALWLVLHPLVHPAARRAAPVFEPIDPEETPKGVALAALKEIEFDRETGKLSDADYELLKAKYTAAALEALREADSPPPAAPLPPSPLPPSRTPPPSEGAAHPTEASCPSCGPRPELDAAFCSNCGRPLARQVAA
jgi:hypothetical protein